MTRVMAVRVPLLLLSAYYLGDIRLSANFLKRITLEISSVGTELSRARARLPMKNTSTPGSPELQRKMSLSDLQCKMSENAGMGIPRPPSAADLRLNA
ncbi:hypothetical protein K438DRAFT_2021553 [Mycena galopus ATCC 62051]|nr:hypothetical protein K438DRAFT_2021553 [Mycena galopus ATCC 62051]